MITCDDCHHCGCFELAEDRIAELEADNSWLRAQREELRDRIAGLEADCIRENQEVENVKARLLPRIAELEALLREATAWMGALANQGSHAARELSFRIDDALAPKIP